MPAGADNVIRPDWIQQGPRPELPTNVSATKGDKGNGGGHIGGMDRFGERLAKVEEAIISLRFALQVMGGAIGLLGAVTLGGFTFLGFQIAQVSGHIDRVEAKVDAIPEKLAAEFRAMRSETAAQTSAIANAITATKQQAPQVILLPAPQPTAPAPKQ